MAKDLLNNEWLTSDLTDPLLLPAADQRVFEIGDPIAPDIHGDDDDDDDAAPDDDDDDDDDLTLAQEGSLGDSHGDPSADLSSAFAVLGPDRLSALQDLASQLGVCKSHFLSNAANYTLRSVASRSRAFESNGNETCKASDIWQMICSVCLEYNFDHDTAANLLHICNIYWQASPTNFADMHQFLDSWPASAKLDLLSALESAGSISEMCQFMAEYHISRPNLPFGAAASVVAVAIREAA